MNRHFEIIPEDGAIVALVEALGFRKPNYGGTIGETLNKIEKNFPNRFAIGIIDNDWLKPNLFDLYSQILQEQDDLQLRQKPQSKHFIIVIHPAIEDWLLQNAKLTNVEHNFLDKKELMRVSKGDKKSPKEVNQFKSFLNALLQVESPGLVTMAKWIEDLYDRHHF